MHLKKIVNSSKQQTRGDSDTVDWRSRLEMTSQSTNQRPTGKRGCVNALLADISECS